jgi:hypothetical protein
MVVPGRIEVSHGNHLPFRMAFCHRLEQHFEAKLGLSVGADGSATEFLSAVVLLAVDCG